MNKPYLVGIALLILAASQLTFAGTVSVTPVFGGGTIANFEGYADGTHITNQYAGVTFSQSGGSPVVNVYPWYFGYGASSGSGVLTGSTDGGAVLTTAQIVATFGSPASNVEFFFSDTAPLGNYTFNAYNSSNSLIDTASILQCCTLPPGYSGGSFPPPGTTPLPGLYVSFFDPGISYVTIGPSSASAGTDAFAIDDFRFNGTPVPEPASLILVGSGLLALGGLFRKRR